MSVIMRFQCICHFYSTCHRVIKLAFIYSGIAKGAGRATAPGAGGQRAPKGRQKVSKMGSGHQNSSINNCLPRAPNFLATPLFI